MALRVVAFAAFIAFTAIILLNLDPLVWHSTALLDFAVGASNLASLFASSLLFYIAVPLGYVLSQLLGQPISSDVLTAACSVYANALGFNPDAQSEVILAFLWSLYYLGFQLLLLIGILAGLLSLVRISGRLTSISFVSMMGLAVLGAYTGSFGNSWSGIPPPPGLAFFASPLFLVAMTCYIYLEASYQLVYFYSILEPPTLREEQLRRQLETLRRNASRQVPVETREVPIPKALQRMLGSDAFRLMREVIEKKLLRRERLYELKETHEIRRLNTYVNRLFQVDPEAESTLTARAGVPSLSKMATLSAASTVLRFLGITLLSYICLNPLVVLTALRAPPIVLQSIDFLLPEASLVILLPLALLFPLASTIVGRFRARRLRQPATPVTPEGPQSQ